MALIEILFCYILIAWKWYFFENDIIIGFIPNIWLLKGSSDEHFPQVGMI